MEGLRARYGMSRVIVPEHVVRHRVISLPVYYSSGAVLSSAGSHDLVDAL